MLTFNQKGVVDTTMAKETELADEQIEKGSVNDSGASIGDVGDEPKSLRGQIEDAIKDTQKDDEEPRQPKEPKDKVERVKEAFKGKKEAVDKTEPKQPREPLAKDIKKDSTQPVVKDEVKKTAPPPGWEKEGKAVWDSLSPDVQKSVLKREKEFSDGIAKYAQKARGYDEYDAVIAPYRQEIQNFGVTPAQTVERLLQWMKAINHPDKTYKLQAFKALAQSFGVDLAQPVQTESAEPPVADPNQPPQWFQQYAGAVNNKLMTIEQQNEARQRASADNALAHWAKDKPYFNQVKGKMAGLIRSGIVPLLEDGTLDLDGAYEKALKLDDDVATQMQQESEAKAAAEAEEKAREAAAATAKRVANARRAGAGLKPAAPSYTPVQAKKLNGQGQGSRTETARESIMRSLSQISDQ